MKKKRGEVIVRVSDLFTKYKQVLRAPQRTVVHTFCEVLTSHYGITVPYERCTYNTKTKTLTLTTSGIVKTEVIRHKKDILKILEELLGKKSAPEQIL